MYVFFFQNLFFVNSVLKIHYAVFLFLIPWDGHQMFFRWENVIVLFFNNLFPSTKKPFPSLREWSLRTRDYVSWVLARFGQCEIKLQEHREVRFISFCCIPSVDPCLSGSSYMYQALPPGLQFSLGCIYTTSSKLAPSSLGVEQLLVVAIWTLYHPCLFP